MTKSSSATFRLRELMPLGRGGMGCASLACVRGVGGFERLVVIKRLNERLAEDEDSLKRLLVEAELAGLVRHANVVAVQYVDRDDQGVFLVLDYIEGGSLKDLMCASAAQGLPRPIALRIMLDCLAGLEAIHCARDHHNRPLNILHRDISPENILVGIDGVTRLTDFGIAKSRASDVRTAPSQTIGKAPYMAPEYLEGNELTPAMDVYGLGITFYELLVGRSPWDGLEEPQLLVRALTEGIPRPLPVNIDRELAEIIEKACAIKVDERYPSAAKMREALLSRRLGTPIASYEDVAKFTNQLVGRVLGRRRSAAAAQLAQGSVPPRALSPDIRTSEIHFQAEDVRRPGDLPTLMYPDQLAGDLIDSSRRQSLQPTLPVERVDKAGGMVFWEDGSHTESFGRFEVDSQAGSAWEAPGSSRSKSSGLALPTVAILAATVGFGVVAFLLDLTQLPQGAGPLTSHFGVSQPWDEEPIRWSGHVSMGDKPLHSKLLDEDLLEKGLLENGFEKSTQRVSAEDGSTRDSMNEKQGVEVVTTSTQDRISKLSSNEAFPSVGGPKERPGSGANKESVQPSAIVTRNPYHQAGFQY